MSELEDGQEFDELYARYRALPEDQLAEIAGGELRLVPRPRARHVRFASGIGALVTSAFQFGAGGPGGWVILDEPEIRFGDELRIPDLAGWRTERYEEPDDGPFLVPPDWICEVLSPSTTRIDRGEKMPLYARHRVEHLWLVDTVAQILEVYRREQHLWLALGTHVGDSVIRAEPFDAVEIDLSTLWRPPTA